MLKNVYAVETVKLSMMLYVWRMGVVAANDETWVDGCHAGGSNSISCSDMRCRMKTSWQAQVWFDDAHTINAW